MKRIGMQLACIYALASVLVGCAFTNHTIVKPYASLQSAAPEGLATKSLAWEEFEFNPTLRNIPNAVAIKKDNHERDSAYIFTEPSPEKWLKKAAQIEFQNVALALTQGRKDEPNIAIVVDQFFAEPDIGFWGADIYAITVLDITVHAPKRGKTYQRRFVGESSSFEFFWLDSDFEERLLQSAQSAFYQAAKETRKLIDREDI